VFPPFAGQSNSENSGKIEFGNKVEGFGRNGTLAIIVSYDHFDFIFDVVLVASKF
jgi:hypothetical protein